MTAIVPPPPIARRLNVRAWGQVAASGKLQVASVHPAYARGCKCCRCSALSQAAAQVLSPAAVVGQKVHGLDDSTAAATGSADVQSSSAPAGRQRACHASAVHQQPGSPEMCDLWQAEARN